MGWPSGGRAAAKRLSTTTELTGATHKRPGSLVAARVLHPASTWLDLLAPRGVPGYAFETLGFLEEIGLDPQPGNHTDEKTQEHSNRNQRPGGTEQLVARSEAPREPSEDTNSTPPL